MFIIKFCFPELFLFGKHDIFSTFKVINKTNISGMLIMYSNNKWKSINYLQYKDVIKTCSFFYFNYGTILLEQKTVKHIINFAYTNGKTMICRENASLYEHCKLELLQ